jgi:hypothetical protein
MEKQGTNGQNAARFDERKIKIVYSELQSGIENHS